MELPESFIQRLKQEYPAEYERLATAFASPAGVSINLHPAKFNAPVGAQPVLWNPDGYFLKQRPAFTYDPWFHAGAYYVQEAGSQLIGALFAQLSLPETPRVLDLCAAPGGKSVHLAHLLAGKGVLVSNEPIKTRVGVLQEHITKAGWDNCMVTQADPAAFGQQEGLFDVILVDAPCSGEGMFRKSEEARTHWSPELVQFCAARQTRLLADVWPALKPGGFLLYSTCTLNRLENEAQLEQLISEYGAKPFSISLPEHWGLHPGSGPTSCWYHWPATEGGEGFFAGILQKEGSFEVEKPTKTTRLRRMDSAPIQRWLQEGTELWSMDNQPIIQSEEVGVLSDILKRSIRVVQTGTTVGMMHGTKFKPDPALALSVHFNSETVTTLNLPEALSFLCGDGVVPAQAVDGWNAVAFEGLPLGWINFLGRRSNNNWPQSWRIRNRPGGALPQAFWATVL